MSSATCRFCGQIKPLCRSHIVPEFLFAPTYDAKGRFISVSSHPHHPVRPVQAGYREQLLCQSCEQRFNRYETPSAAALRAIYAHDPRGDYIDVGGCDQRALKLLSLAILWRAHVSSLHQFAPVKLGPYAAVLHRMLESEDPGGPFDVGVLLVRLRGSATGERMVVPPTRVRFAGLNAYQMIAVGLQWVFITSKQTAGILAGYPIVGATDDLRIPVVDVTDGEVRERLHHLTTKWGKL